MISIEQIQKFYPLEEQVYKQFLLKEYLQYQILDIIYSSQYGQKLIFLGGTAIRLIHNSRRFSEDLDFDNFGLSIEDFEKLSEYIGNEMNTRGFETEFRNVFTGAYHCYIKIPKILKHFGFSQMSDEKILIQLDSVSQEYNYSHDTVLLDKFEVYRAIQVCPVDILLSKKIHALIDRKRTKGRDFFDIIFLKKFTEPNYEYLQDKIGIKDASELQEILYDFCDNIDLITLAGDVEPFLINPRETKRVKDFKNFIKQF